MLILDEATSSPGIPGKRAIQRTRSTVLHGRIAVMITHGLSAAVIAGQVFAMEYRRTVEGRSPNELIARTGWFGDLRRAWRDSPA